MDTQTLTKVIRDKFISYRVKSGLSLADMEAETGVSKSTLSRFQNGLGDYDLDTLAPLAQYFNVRLSPGAVSIQSDPLDTLGGVRLAIENDQELTPAAKKALYELMEVAYRGFVETQDE